MACCLLATREMATEDLELKCQVQTMLDSLISLLGGGLY